MRHPKSMFYDDLLSLKGLRMPKRNATGGRRRKKEEETFFREVFDDRHLCNINAINNSPEKYDKGQSPATIPSFGQ
jgi:hypothetical protein